MGSLLPRSLSTLRTRRHSSKAEQLALMRAIVGRQRTVRLP